MDWVLFKCSAVTPAYLQHQRREHYLFHLSSMLSPQRRRYSMLCNVHPHTFWVRNGMRSIKVSTQGYIPLGMYIASHQMPNLAHTKLKACSRQSCSRHQHGYSQEVFYQNCRRRKLQEGTAPWRSTTSRAWRVIFNSGPFVEFTKLVNSLISTHKDRPCKSCFLHHVVTFVFKCNKSVCL